MTARRLERTADGVGWLVVRVAKAVLFKHCAVAVVVAVVGAVVVATVVVVVVSGCVAQFAPVHPPVHVHCPPERELYRTTAV